MRSRVASGLLCVVALAAGAAPAHAAGGTLSDVADPGSFPDRTWLLEVSGRDAVEPEGVAVRENGAEVDGLRVAGTASGAASFGTLLMIDSSGSMKGKPIRAAMEAARAFAAQRKPGHALGVMLFNGRNRVALAPTTDVEKIDEALGKMPPLGRGTRINDAVDAAAGVMRSSGARVRSVILLSDGADSGSKLSDSAAIRAAEAAGIRVFTVGLQSRSFVRGGLERLAERTGGSAVVADSPESLRPIFDQLGARLGSEFLVTYRSPSKSGSRVAVTVDLDSDGQTDVRAAYLAPVAGVEGASGRVQATGFWGSTTAVGAVTLTFGLLVALGIGMLIKRPAHETIMDRMAAYSADAAAHRGEPAGSPLSGLTASLERMLEATTWWGKFVDLVDIARVTRTPAQLALYTVMSTLIAMLLAVAASFPLLIVLALAVPAVLLMVLRFKAKQQRKLFGEQLADNLQVFASALRAGHSFTGALGTVIEDAPEPTRREFQRALTDERLGVPIDEALAKIGTRMHNREMNQVAMIAALQQETGGNTAEVLDRVVDAVRERQELLRLVRSLTAQGRVSQVVVSALPFAMAGAVTVMNPGYLSPMLESHGGRIALGAGVVMVALGSFAIKKIVDIKV